MSASACHEHRSSRRWSHDVPGWSTTPGTTLDLWDCNGGANQSWDVRDDGRITVYADMCMTARTDRTVTIEDCAGSTEQTWSVNADQTITSSTGLCLTAAGTGNGSAVTVTACSGSSSQKWTFA